MNFKIRSVKNQFSFIRSCYRIYYIKRKKPDIIELFMVRITGVEPAPSCPDWHLKPARLPIPPYPHNNQYYFNILSQTYRFVKSFYIKSSKITF